jgi:creatinine amidohydrolase
MTTVRMEAMTWTDYAARIAAGAAVIVPVGSIEQHGPHLPLDTDIRLAAGLAELTCQRANALTGPAIPFGYKSQALSGGGQVFAGTTSLSGQTLTLLVHDVLAELQRHGARKILLLSGHGENQFFLFEAADLALKGRTGYRVAVTGWWQHVPQHLLDELFDGRFPGWDLEHAATTETALMLALSPASVKLERIRNETVARVPNFSLFPQPDGLVPASGLLSSASAASEEMGRRLVDTIVSALVSVLDEAFA